MKIVLYQRKIIPKLLMLKTITITTTAPTTTTEATTTAPTTTTEATATAVKKTLHYHIHNKISNSDNGNGNKNESDRENPSISDKNQVIPGATVNNNKNNFHQREETTPGEKPIVSFG